jgi:hypothetical protein
LQEEYTYLAIFILAGFFVLLIIWRFIRAAGSTIGQLRFEAERDRYQHQRIAWEKERQYQAFRKSTRKINGKARRVKWDRSDRRAQRDFHIDESADEVFDSSGDYWNKDVRTPWGWPSSAGKRINPAGYRRRPSLRSRMGKSISEFFRPKQVIDDEYRARRERNIRHLVEDRYGPVGQGPQMTEFEWSSPQLPAELLKEREADQVLAQEFSKDPDKEVRNIKAFRLVSDMSGSADARQRASGQ